MKMHSTTEGRVTGLSVIVCHVQKRCTQRASLLYLL